MNAVPPDATRLRVGFDLDMTLVDSSRGIAACMQYALRKHGGEATDEELWALIGRPLEENLAHFLPMDQVAEAAADYRAAHHDIAVPLVVPLPGALELVAAIRDGGGTVFVVSAKEERAIADVLDHIGMTVDAISGGGYAQGKAVALTTLAANAYVGDHLGDVVAAQTAGVRSVAVATGPYDANALREAGADLVVDSLTELDAAALLG